ncbi:phosphopantetheine-binding protein [Steroidobacter flavus]|uniref:Phosphopantetheine-binding protein n=1 Tax=Steroidobacter flavus TaxID=1842136 RepID=A0ABV8SN30_9GAMM
MAAGDGDSGFSVGASSLLDASAALKLGEIEAAIRPEHHLLLRKFVPPATQTERTVANIWADALKIARIGRGDNFFELGGHSLMVLRVIAQVKRQFGIEVAMVAIFHFPELRQFCAHVDEIRFGRASK